MDEVLGAGTLDLSAATASANTGWLRLELGSPAVVVVGDVVRGVAAAHQHQPLLSTA